MHRADTCGRSRHPCRRRPLDRAIGADSEACAEGAHADRWRQERPAGYRLDATARAALPPDALEVSAKNGEGIDALRAAIAARLVPAPAERGA